MSELRADPKMCEYCFDVITAKLSNKLQEAFDFNIDKNISCPVFVTLHLINGRDKELRGCIGTLSEIILASELKRFALSSAFKDSRFPPLMKEELPNLELSVSLLVNYEVGKNCYDWEVGKHGIIIEFVVKGRNYNATYLPEVASEQGWTQQEAILSLTQKAGYRGNVTQEFLMSIKLTKYQSSKHHMTYIDYLSKLNV